MSKKTEINIAKTMAEIEEIVEWFESSQVDIDKAIIKYETALKKINTLQDYLKRAELKVRDIEKKHQS